LRACPGPCRGAALAGWLARSGLEALAEIAVQAINAGAARGCANGCSGPPPAGSDRAAAAGAQEDDQGDRDEAITIEVNM
jgi:hypothetical protein